MPDSKKFRFVIKNPQKLQKATKKNKKIGKRDRKGTRFFVSLFLLREIESI